MGARGRAENEAEADTLWCLCPVNPLLYKNEEESRWDIGG